MIRIILACLFLSAASLTAGCDSGAAPQAEDAAAPVHSTIDPPVDDAHNAANALDWAGTYRGTLPCADCEGIDTTLTLRADGTYALKTVYLGKDAPVFSGQGGFQWGPDGNTLVLHGDEMRHYRVGENRLTHLDNQGQVITGPLAARYVLAKTGDNAVREKYWKLVELRGQAVGPSNEAPHIILKAEGNRVIGSGGCNRMSGMYELREPGRIRFTDIATTEKACAEGIDVEAELHRVLESADSYVVDGDTLVLHRARMAPLARFEAVWLP